MLLFALPRPLSLVGSCTSTVLSGKRLSGLNGSQCNFPPTERCGAAFRAAKICGVSLHTARVRKQPKCRQWRMQQGLSVWQRSVCNAGAPSPRRTQGTATGERGDRRQWRSQGSRASGSGLCATQAHRRQGAHRAPQQDRFCSCEGSSHHRYCEDSSSQSSLE